MAANAMNGAADIERALVAHLRRQAAPDAAHDLAHILRVLKTARRIAEEEGAHDPIVLTAAALLHDLVALPKNHPDRAQSSRLAAAAATELLQGLGFPEARLGAVAHAIEAHSFTAHIEPRTPEARALQDADRLDALGAIGLARCFAVSGALGRSLVDTEDPLAEHRPLDDGRWALDHVQVKLLRLPGLMRTAAGRRIGAERAAFVEAFMRRMATECQAGTGDVR
jgi:uncharacterized protein